MTSAFEAVADLVRHPDTRVLSLDCFDTVLLRRVPKPPDVHLVVGHRLVSEGALLPHVGAEGFAKLRRLAEVEARRSKRDTSATPEVSLSEIYDILWPSVWRDPPQGEPEATEVAVETGLLFASEQLGQFVGALLEGCPRTLIVVSDTYFSEAHLRGFLAASSLKGLPFERVFTSSDAGTGKGGELWPTVVQEMGVDPYQIVHVGDNEEADVRCAARAGIRAFHLPISSERFAAIDIREGIVGREDYPSKWCDPVWGDGGTTALRRRATLLPAPDITSQDEQVAWETGTSIFGPVFTGFAQWVHEQSEVAGAERLLFLMREGQLLMQFAQKAKRPPGWEPSLRTAWVSREACARASIFTGSEAELMAFLDRLRPPPPSHLLQSFGLDPADLPELEELERAFRLSSDREACATSFVELILGRPGLVEKVVRTSARRRGHLMRYLRERAGPGRGPVGLVDVGWSGSIQESLHNMFRADDEPLRFHGLYLLAHVGSSDRALRGVRLQGYLGTLGTDPFDVAAITGGAEIVELVSTCAEGSLLEIGPGGEPILAPAAGGCREQRSRELVQQGALAYQEAWLSHHQNGGRVFETTGAGTALLTRVLKRFVSQPNHDEALAFSWWLHEENYGSDGTEQLVPPRYLPTLGHRSAEDLHWAPMSDLHWTGGAAALVDNELSDAIFFMREATIDPGRFSSPPGGRCVLRVHGADGGVEEHEIRLVRNRHGLTHVEWRIPVQHARAISLSPADHFALLRPDVLEVVDAEEESRPLFAWNRGDVRDVLPTSRMRWLTLHVLALEPHSAFELVFDHEVTTRELRITLAGAIFPTAEVTDGHLIENAEEEIAALRREIAAVYSTKVFRVLALPRRMYGALRSRRDPRPPK